MWWLLQQTPHSAGKSCRVRGSFLLRIPLGAILADWLAVLFVGVTLIGLHQETRAAGKLIFLTWNYLNIKLLAREVY